MRAALAMTLALASAVVSSAPALESVTVHGTHSLGPLPRTPVGFLHGVDEQQLPLSADLVGRLRPANWRLYKAASYLFVDELDPDMAITYGLSDHYAWSQGGFPEARPWLDWAGYEAYIAEVLEIYGSYFADHRPAFHDVWNEPDLTYFWSGTYDQLLELFARAHGVIKAHDPDARVVGPSVAHYARGSGGVSDIVAFAVDLDERHGVRLDALAWHENGSGSYGGDLPERIAQHAYQIRFDLEAHFGPEYQPELHVNEYAGAQVHLSPGYNVGYLYYLLQARVDAAMRACWNVYSGDAPDFELWSNCWEGGLCGMFMDDGETPLPPYWVYRAYAEMTTGARVLTASSSGRTNLLATRHDDTETLRILLGRYNRGGPDEISVTVESPYAHETVSVRVARIPHHPDFFDTPYPRAIPLPDGPVDAYAEMHPVVDGRISLLIGPVADHDAMVVTIEPEGAVGVYEHDGSSDPSPRLSVIASGGADAVATLEVTLPGAAHTVLEVFDVTGRRVRGLVEGSRSAGTYRVAWDGTTDGADRVAPGVYYVRLQARDRSVVARILHTH